MPHVRVAARLRRREATPRGIGQPTEKNREEPLRPPRAAHRSTQRRRVGGSQPSGSRANGRRETYGFYCLGKRILRDTRRQA